jgi:hypothetical protein
MESGEIPPPMEADQNPRFRKTIGQKSAKRNVAAGPALRAGQNPRFQIKVPKMSKKECRCRPTAVSGSEPSISAIIILDEKQRHNIPLLISCCVDLMINDRRHRADWVLVILSTSRFMQVLLTSCAPAPVQLLTQPAHARP